MANNNTRQWMVLGILVISYALIVLATYGLTPLDQLAAPGQTVPTSVAEVPRWQLALGSAGIVLVVYGALGGAGYWFYRRLDLPGVYRAGAGWRAWILRPMLLGLGLGLIIVLVDQVFARLTSTPGFPHPAFPLSLLASGAAGIGEEILFRGFVLGLWAFLLNLLLRRWNGRLVALWIANGIAALTFSASHLPAAMILFNVTNPMLLPWQVWADIFVLNSVLGLVAGQRSWRDGLVTAMGIHFWADILWHVVWPLLRSAAG